MAALRLGLAQLAPRLGDVAANVELHHAQIGAAREQGAQLLVCPELGLTGYLLSDLNAEVAMRADDARLAGLAAAAGPMSVIVGFVEEADDHRLFIAAALLEDGAVRHVTRKAYLPNYGLFDERRFFAAGDRVAAVDSRLGLRLGVSICEDFWHLPTALLLALDGAQLQVNISSSPGRDVAAVVEGGLGTAESWRAVLKTYAMLTTSPVVYVNRVGVEESVTFWGGSEVVDASGESVFRAPLHDEGLFVVELDMADMRRQRVSMPLLRDERPELVARQLERIMRTRAGQPPADEAPAEDRVSAE
jgi:predicted amidohydrolase